MTPDRNSSNRQILLVIVLFAGIGIGSCLGQDRRFEFVQVKPGEFVMGCSAGQSQCDDDETPPHRVKFSNGFEIGKYEVTQAQWIAVMGSNPSQFRGLELPVENVSWECGSPIRCDLESRWRPVPVQASDGG